MGDYAPRVIPGNELTYIAGATITGGQVVHITATGVPAVVSPTSAASNHVVGVAAFDAASGAPVTVIRGGIQLPLATGAVTAGTPVKSGTAGTVVPWVSGTDDASLIVGVAQTTATDAIVEVLWRA